MSGADENSRRRSGRARKPKRFEGFEVKIEKIDYSYGDVKKPEHNKDEHSEGDVVAEGGQSNHEERPSPKKLKQNSKAKNHQNKTEKSVSKGNRTSAPKELKATSVVINQSKKESITSQSKQTSKDSPRGKSVKSKHSSLEKEDEKRKRDSKGKEKSVTEKDMKVITEGNDSSSDIRRSARSNKGKRKVIDDDFITPNSIKKENIQDDQSEEEIEDDEDEDYNEVHDSDSSEINEDESEKETEEDVSLKRQKKLVKTKKIMKSKSGAAATIKPKVKKRKKEESTKDSDDSVKGRSPKRKKTKDVTDEKDNDVIDSAKETWSFVKTQFETLSNILSEAGIENVILTSLIRKKQFEFEGSERGKFFLENRVGIKDKVDNQEGSQKENLHLENGALVEEQISTHASTDADGEALGSVSTEEEHQTSDPGRTEVNRQTNFVWKIVEKQARNVVKLLSDVGVDSLMLTSVMDSQGFGCVGSTKGLEFIMEISGLAELFVNYCSGTIDAEHAEKSVFGRWYKFFTGEEIEETKKIEFPKNLDYDQIRNMKKEASALFVGEEAPDVDFTAMEFDEENPTCPVCSKEFKSVKTLRKHYYLHSGKKTFVCEVCNKAFMRKWDCQQHMIRKHEYVCANKGEVIRRDLADAKNLFTRRISDIIDLQNENVTKVGGSGQGSSVDLVSETVSEADQSDTQGQGDSKEVAIDASGDASVAIESEEGETNSAPVDITQIALEEIKGPGIPDVDLSINWDIEQNPSEETGEELALTNTDQFACSQCGKKLKNALMLQKHVENHLARKVVDCLVEGCHKRFKRKYDMEYHLVAVHGYMKLGPGNVVPKDQLPDDYKEQLKKLKRKKLRRGKKPEEIEFSDDENDPIERLLGTQCPVCDAKFKSNVVLKRHFIIHVGKKDFICEVCSKCFLRKYDMQNHQVNVHGYQKLKKGMVVKPEKTTDQEVDDLIIPLGMNTHTQGRKRTIHKCQYCDAVAFSRINFDLHLEQCHADENPFPCSQCDKVFKTKRKMKMHWYLNHKEKKHKCRFCDKVFAFRFHLRDHEETHAEEGGFLCGSCGKSFSKMTYLKKHELRHHGTIKSDVIGLDNKMYTCRYCSQMVEGLGNFQIHMRTHTSEEERKYQCEVCEKRFFTIGHLKRHVFVHKEERDHHCDQCNKTYKDPDTLKKHQIAMHNMRIETRQVYTCPEPECEGRSFLSMGHLKRHMFIHKGIKPHKCEECGRCFTEKATLLSHIRTHTGEKPYVCTECDRAFTQQSHLRRHMYLHTQVRNFICQLCGRGFFAQEDLKKHMVFHSNIRPHKCQYCSKAFHHLSSLKTHLRCHLGEKPFQCDICKQRFTQKNSMLIHRRRHTGERPFKCSECGKCFISKQLCKLHLRSHFPGQYPRHECPKCKKDYSGRQKLRLHIMKEHSEDDLQMIPNYEEPIVLIIKNVKDADGKMREEVVHDDDSEYDSNYSEEEELQEEESELTCDICFLKFPDKETVAKHKIMHADQSAFECQVCLETFDSVAKLHQHLMGKHGFVKLTNGDVVRKQMESKVQMQFEEGDIKTVYVALESPTKYLNKTTAQLAPKATSFPVAIAPNPLVRVPSTTEVTAVSAAQNIIPGSVTPNLIQESTSQNLIQGSTAQNLIQGSTAQNLIQGSTAQNFIQGSPHSLSQGSTAQTLVPTQANTFRIAPSSSNQRKSFNIVEKDGTILHIVSPPDVHHGNHVDTFSVTTTEASDNTSYMSLPHGIVTEDNGDAMDTVIYSEDAPEVLVTGSEVSTEEIQTIIVSAGQEEVAHGDFVPESSQEDAAIKSIMNYRMEDAMQYVQEEVIETQVVPEATGDMQDTELESAISQIDFDQGGGITEMTAANLAALYGTDKIIYQEERSDGTEVVHVYAVVQKENTE